MEFNSDDYALDCEQLVLDSGLRVIHRHTNAPDVVVTTRVREGAMREPEEERGILHLIEHLLYRSHDNSDLKARLFAITGRSRLSAHVDNECISGDARIPAHRLPEYLSVWGNSLANTAYDAQVFDREKLTVQNEVAGSESPGTVGNYVEHVISNHLYPGHPLGRSTHPAATVGTLTSADVAGYKHARINANNTILCIVGGYDQMHMEDMLNASFQGLAPGELRPILTEHVPPVRPLDEVKEFDTLTSPELSVFMQSPGFAEEDQVHFSILRQYLGGGPSSRLQKTVREEKGLAYTASFHGGNTFLNTNSAYISIKRFRSESRSPILGFVRDELERARQGDFDLELLETMRQGTLTSYWENNLETLEGQAHELDSKYGLGILHVGDERLQIWQDVTPEDLARVAQRVFNDRYVTLTFLPKHQ